MSTKLYNRIREERAQSLAEYVLVIVVISLAVVAALTFLRGSIADLF